jgi:S-adenosylmethionine:tRNA ribosyltransferase-isomerase
VLERGSGGIRHARFRDVVGALRPHSLLVINDTRVFPARLRGRKPSGGGIEVLLVRRADADAGAASGHEDGPAAAPSGHEDWEVLVKGWKGVSRDADLSFAGSLGARLLRRGERGAAVLRFMPPPGSRVLSVAGRAGTVPLPPYIKRDDRPSDRERYQTVYASVVGSVAAPTAGLHFTEALLGGLAGPP